MNFLLPLLVCGAGCAAAAVEAAARARRRASLDRGGADDGRDDRPAARSPRRKPPRRRKHSESRAVAELAALDSESEAPRAAAASTPWFPSCAAVVTPGAWTAA